ncbi:unnamed protein product, partial [Discosporangium mesarthrocarpum]
MCRIRCNECKKENGVDICLDCFSKGLEFDQHKKDHDYRVIGNLNFPIFQEGWCAWEELIMVDKITTLGLASWDEIAIQV